MSTSATGTIHVFVSSLSANKEIRRKQSQMLQVLQVKKIEFQEHDIASNDDDKQEFRRLMTDAGDPNALPPRIFNGDQYCGGYEDFYEAVEEMSLNSFLRLPSAVPAVDNTPAAGVIESITSSTNVATMS